MKISLGSVPVQDPLEAHEIYTTKLGFVSKDYNPDAQLAVIISADDLSGTVILLEPCKGNFAAKLSEISFRRACCERLSP